MRYSEIKIVEALKASQYRNLVKGWNKERYAEIFLNPKYKHDRNGYRVYIPIEEKFRPANQQKSPTQVKIEQELLKNNYEIVDYIKGLARQIGVEKNSVKLGKLLNTLKRQDLLNEFNVDKSREGTKSTYMVVISRHPYDIAGMSTDRGWTSCMNLKNGINRRYVPLDIAAGSVVAYVTRTDDLDLKNPSGRLLIKPFVDVIGNKVIYFGIEARVYGTDVPGFTETVQKWVYEVNNAHELEEVVVLKMDSRLYPDSDLSSQTYVRGKSLSPEVKSQIERVRQNPFDIFDIENPSEAVQLAGLAGTGYQGHRVFTKLMSNPAYIPSERIQILAIDNDSDAIDLILNSGTIVPSDNVQIAMVSNDWRHAETLLRRDIKMSDRVVEIAVEKEPYFMSDLSKAGYQITKNMLIRGLNSNGSILRTYYSEGFPVDLDIEMVAVENGFADVDALYNRYKEKNQKIPTKLIDAMTKSSKVGYLFSKMILHNRNYRDYPDDIIPIPFTEKQLVRAMIADIQGQNRELYKDVLDLREEQPMVSENGWVEFIKGANPSRSVIRRLIIPGVLSDKAIRHLLPKFGFLLEFIPDATYDEQVAAIKNDPGLVKLIPESSPKLQELQILAVTLDPNAISVIDNPSFDIFKIAASYKEPNWNEQDGLGTLYVYEFLTSLKYGANRGLLTEENKNQILTMLIKSEPRRIISLINYDDEDFPVTEELQLLAVDKSPRMVDTLLNYNKVPSTQVLIKHIEAGGRLGTVLDKLRIINRYSSTETIEIDDAVYLAYLDKKQRDPDEARWLLSAALNNNLNPGNAVVDAILKIHPKSIVTALAYKLDISDNQILDAIKRDGVNSDNTYTFLSAIEQRYGNLPEQILLAYMESNTSSDPRNLITNLLDITGWAKENDQEIPPSVYKYAIKKEYGSVLVLNVFKRPLSQEFMQELKDYNYKVNGYWQPLDVGDLVRLTNQEATPKFKITGMRGDSYLIGVDGKTESFPKDRIHRANSIAEPADYEQKRKLFVKRFPIDAALTYLESNAVKASAGVPAQILNSQFQDTLKKYEITDTDDIDRLKLMLQSSMIQLVDQYLPTIWTPMDNF
jgi:hypothetical protein